MGRKGSKRDAKVIALLPGSHREDVEGALGAPVVWCAGATELLEAAAAGPWSVMLLALDHDAIDEVLVSRVAQADGAGAVFLTSVETSVDRVIAAERAGSVALLSHPPTDEELRREVRPVVEEPGEVDIPPDAPSDSGFVVGSSQELMDVFRVVARVAPTPVTVLITGESGTGKELVARALHDQGARRDGPFVAVNCAAIPDTLLEAELFGYEKGAFTGAVTASEGRFGRAHGGTLFLDEIGELSLPLQAKLLRVLETGDVERLGGGQAVSVDARVVAATNQPLRQRAEAGRFREDLLFRLAVVEVDLPPLRRRREDVLPLALHFASRLSARYGRPVRALSTRAREKLGTYPWPGNVRELRNVMDRAVLLARGGVIRSLDVQLGADAPRLSPLDQGVGVGYPPTLSLREVEADHIRNVLAHTGGRMGEAAEILGIHRNTMTMKVREYGIDVDAIAEHG
jgi:DNA-binding NtrC family response regulator